MKKILLSFFRISIFLLFVLTPNDRINSDWQFRCAPLPAGHADIGRNGKATL